MGIVNATPDSFSDGGRYFSPSVAVEHALTLLMEGAAVLDIGGESTRPGSVPVSAEEELSRVVPVIEGVRKCTGAPISVDTSKAVVARAALEAGADIVNDVTACRDDGMAGVLRDFRAGCVLMDDRPLPGGSEAFSQVRGYLLERREALMASTGLEASYFLLDPGVGFGKDLEQNLECVRRAAEFADGESGALLGVSRKSFIGKICGESEPCRRLPGTLAVAVLSRRVQVLRVHDVSEHRQVLQITQAIQSL